MSLGLDSVDLPAVVRAVHVLAVFYWMGGIVFVTLILQPAIRRYAPPRERRKLYKAMHDPFGETIRWAILLVGLTGYYLLDHSDMWWLFRDPHYWYLHAMVLVWCVEAFFRFAYGPFYMHIKNERMSQSDPEKVFDGIVFRHRLVTALALPTMFAAVMGAHGYLPF